MLLFVLYDYVKCCEDTVGVKLYYMTMSSAVRILSVSNCAI